MTEITDKTISEAQGVIFFDATCGPCTTGAHRLDRFLGQRGYVFLPLQDPCATRLTHLSPDELRREMKLRLADGRILGGVDAFLHLGRSLCWIRPFAWIAAAPGVRLILDHAYARFARNRSRLPASCSVNRRDRFASLRWLIPLALLVTICAIRPLVAPWVAMWMIAGAIFASLKLWTWWPLRAQATTGGSFAYFLACATLDAKRFLFGSPTEKSSAIRAIGHVLIGAISLFASTRLVPTSHPLLVGWVGMIGVVLMLHFGLLELLAIAWRRAGVDAPLVMNKPLSFVSLSDFWSRWNRPFTTFAFDTIFRPLRRFSVTLATLATFLFSGLIHDLAISVPTGAGFGRPTLYFLIQGIAILVERKMRFSRNRRRLFAVVVLVAPVSLLFHPPFIHNVILPMLSAIHALGKELP